MFISSLGIIYKGRSVDPLFPADEPVLLPGHNQPLFRNSNPRARPFACIDETEICLPNGLNCWPFYGKSPDDDNPQNVSFPPEFWFTYSALLKSSSFFTMVKRLGRSLLAQGLVSGYQSQELASDHWEKEIQNVFATSLARIQFDAWSIATAEDKSRGEKDGYFRALDPRDVGDLCEIYKFRPVSGYVSIDVATLLVVCFSTIVMFALSRRVWSWRRMKGEARGRFRALASFRLRRALGVASAQDRSRLQDQDPSGIRSTSEPESQTTLPSPPAGSSDAPANPSLPLPLVPEERSGQDDERMTSRQQNDTTSSPHTYGTMGASTTEREVPARSSDSGSDSDIQWEPLVIDKLIYGVWTTIIWAFRVVGVVLDYLWWLPSRGAPMAFSAVAVWFRRGQNVSRAGGNTA